MTDRELLELAAKAAGLTPDTGVKIKTGHMLVKGDDTQHPFFWNPLTDDGDSLRLAVKLKLSVWFEEREHHEWTHIIWVSPVFEPYTGDVNAATRRAIVRAAAEIGKEMTT